MKSGIYKIVNLVNGKIYIGFTVNFNRRKSCHFKSLEAGVHKNEHLQKAYNKYGKVNFQFEIIEYCDEEKLNEREDYWVSFLNVHDSKFGYNIRPTHPTGNCRHSIETRKKLSKSKKGKRVQTEKSIEKMLATKKERGTNKLSEETKQKISKALTGKHHSEATKEKLRNRPITEEHRERARVLHTGRKQSIAERLKRSQIAKGKKKPDGFGKTLSVAKKGKVMCKEAIEKMRITKSIPIIQSDLNGKFIKEWTSANEAARVLGFSDACINSVCNQKKGRTQHKGFKWSFKK